MATCETLEHCSLALASTKSFRALSSIKFRWRRRAQVYLPYIRHSLQVASCTLQTTVIPAGTRILVRTIDAIDSTRNHAGDRFEASLEEPLIVDGNVVAPKGADVYGRLEESKETGTFTGRSQLRLQLTGIVVNGQTVALVTGEYELTGKSKGASTARRTAGGSAIGGILGAIAGGGKGAGIGAGTGAGLGAGSEINTKSIQVKIPSETLLDFTLQQSVTIPKHANTQFQR